MNSVTLVLREAKCENGKSYDSSLNMLWLDFIPQIGSTFIFHDVEYIVVEVEHSQASDEKWRHYVTVEDANNRARVFSDPFKYDDYCAELDEKNYPDMIIS